MHIYVSATPCATKWRRGLFPGQAKSLVDNVESTKRLSWTTEESIVTRMVRREHTWLSHNLQYDSKVYEQCCILNWSVSSVWKHQMAPEAHRWPIVSTRLSTALWLLHKMLSPKKGDGVIRNHIENCKFSNTCIIKFIKKRSTQNTTIKVLFVMNLIHYKNAINMEFWAIKYK